MTSCKLPEPGAPGVLLRGGADDVGLPRALGPTPPAACPGEAVEVLDDVVRVVAEGHERDAYDGARAAAAAHAVHGDADPSAQVVDDVGRRDLDSRALTLGIVGIAAAHEILEPHRGDRARRGVVRGRFVREAHDVADAVLVQHAPVGPARVRHPGERDRLACDPVEVVGHAQVAEEAGIRAGREDAAGDSSTGSLVREALAVMVVGLVTDAVGDESVDLGVLVAELVQDRPRSSSLFFIPASQLLYKQASF